MNHFIKQLRITLMRTIIKNADNEEMGKLLHNILHRYSEQYPNDEFLFLTLPKSNHQERIRILTSLGTFLEEL